MARTTAKSKEQLTEAVLVRMTPSERRAAQERADREDRSLSSVVRIGLRQLLGLTK